MKNVKWLPLLLLLPLAQGAEPSDAAQLWQAEYGTDLVIVADFPAEIQAGDQFQATLQLREPVDAITYQICNIGNACWVTNVPVAQQGNNWTLHTADIPALQSDIFDEPIHFEEGFRVGIQYFITIGNETHLFPHGEECDLYAPKAEWVACEETHYFGLNVIAGEQETPAAGLPFLGLGLLALLRVRRV